MATSPCSLTQASCVATERCWPQRSRAACQPRIWRGLLRAHRLAPERARQEDAQPAHSARCKCGPVLAQMWPSPRADVAEAKCRCGRVPVQMWHSPMQMCASPSADVVQTSWSEWRIARERSSAPQRQSSPVRSATVPSRSSLPAGLHGGEARPRKSQFEAPQRSSWQNARFRAAGDVEVPPHHLLAVPGRGRRPKKG